MGGSSQESQNIVYSFFLFWSFFCFSKVVLVFSLGTSAKSLKILLFSFFSHSFDGYILGFLCDDHPE